MNHPNQLFRNDSREVVQAIYRRLFLAQHFRHLSTTMHTRLFAVTTDLEQASSVSSDTNLAH